jgi:hypothetical protein
LGLYYVKTIVEYSGEVEADSEAEAEAIGWKFDEELQYDGVYSIDVEELDEPEEEDE